VATLDWPPKFLHRQGELHVKGRSHTHAHLRGQIIVVDDDPLIRQMVTSFFIDYNFPAASAACGSELRRRFQGSDPSLIILDLRVERESGLDLLKEIRSRSDIPVIVTGQCLDEADRILSLELGADDCMAKPFSVRELLARAKAILRRQRIGRTARHQTPDRRTSQSSTSQLAVVRASDADDPVMASCRKGPQPETGVACTAERSKIAPWPSFLSWLMEGFALYGASIYSMEAYHHADLEADSLTEDERDKRSKEAVARF